MFSFGLRALPMRYIIKRGKKKNRQKKKKAEKFARGQTDVAAYLSQNSTVVHDRLGLWLVIATRLTPVQLSGFLLIPPLLYFIFFSLLRHKASSRSFTSMFTTAELLINNYCHQSSVTQSLTHVQASAAETAKLV